MIVYLNQDGIAVNEDGEPVKTKWEHPYSYDPILQYFNGTEGKATVYSDRMFQWDSEKFNQLCQKHFGNHGQSFENREAEVIEQFLSDYLGQAVVLNKITEYCNQSSGYPLWRFDYTTK